MNQFYSKPTLIFLYVLHAIPAIYFIINIPYLLAACGLVECLWWQQLQIQLLPLLAAAIPLIALYFQQKGKIYAGYLFVISLAYYGWYFWQSFLSGSEGYFVTLNSLLMLVLLLIFGAQLFLVGKTTYALLNPPSKKNSKKNHPLKSYNDLLIIGGIVIIAFLIVRLFLLSPAPSTEADCANIKNQEKADTCYATLGVSIDNAKLCTKIGINRNAMVNCLGSVSDYTHPSLCDEAKNKGLCFFGMAIIKKNLDLCAQADNNEECETIVKSVRSALTKETVDISSSQCSAITFNSWYRDLCLTAAAYNQKDTESCNAISNSYQKAVCILNIAVSQKNCSEIPENLKMSKGDSYIHVRDECFLSLALEMKDVSICNLLSDKGWASICIQLLQV